MNLVEQPLERNGFISNETTEIFTLCYNFITQVFTNLTVKIKIF